MATNDDRRQAARDLGDAARDLELLSSRLGQTDGLAAALQRLDDAERTARAAGVPWWRR